MGPGALGFSAPGLVLVGGGVGHSEAGDGRKVAPGRISALWAAMSEREGPELTPHNATRELGGSVGRVVDGLDDQDRLILPLGAFDFRAGCSAILTCVPRMDLP